MPLLFFVDNYHQQTRKRHPLLDLPTTEHLKVSIPIHIATGLRKRPFFFYQMNYWWKLLYVPSSLFPPWSRSLFNVRMLLTELTMLKKILFFKKSVYWTEILPFIIFRWLMVVVQAICITVLMVGTFDVVLNNVGEPVSGSLGTLSRKE